MNLECIIKLMASAVLVWLFLASLFLSTRVRVGAYGGSMEKKGVQRCKRREGGGGSRRGKGGRKKFLHGEERRLIIS